MSIRHARTGQHYFNDTLRPLPFQMRLARFMSAPVEEETPPAPPAEDPPPADPPAETPPAQEDTTDWTAEARKWEKRAKENKTAAEERDALKAALAKALGQDSGAGDPDPAQLTQQITERDTTIATLQAENTILRHATRAGGNPDTLLDSKRFTDSLSGVDLGDEKAVTDHIKAFVRDNPTYALTGGTPGSRDAGAGHGHQPAPLDSIPAGTPRMAAAFEQEMASKTHRK